MPADLWSFAIHFYARPGVEEACLRLQAEGADICLLLCGAWLGRRGVACTAPRLEHLSALAQPWQSTVVEPLRRLRQDWRAAAASDGALAKLREQLKGVELEAERQLLLRLEAATQAWPEGTPENPAAWLEGLAASADLRCRDALHRLNSAAVEM